MHQHWHMLTYIRGTVYPHFLTPLFKGLLTGHISNVTDYLKSYPQCVWFLWMSSWSPLASQLKSTLGSWTSHSLWERPPTKDKLPQTHRWTWVEEYLQRSKSFCRYTQTYIEIYVKYINHTYTILVCSHVLSKCRPTQFIGTKKAEVTWYLPHNGGRQSLVEAQRTVCLQHSLYYCPHCAGATAQNTTQSLTKSNRVLLVQMSCFMATLTSSVRLQSCHKLPFHAWPAGDISPAQWGILPWKRRWKLKSLLMPSEYHCKKI